MTSATLLPSLGDVIDVSALRGLLRVDCVVLIESLSILDIDSIEIPLRTEDLQKETGRGEEWKGEERSGRERRER